MNGVKQPNPWDVSSIFEFNYFVCPECDCKIRIKQDFINHAVYNHPWVSIFRVVILKVTIYFFKKNW